MSDLDFDLPEEAPPEGAPEWMVTFADLMSLLLTFFVLLLSFSNMEIIKFRTMAGSVRNALGLKSELDLSDIPMGHTILPYEDPREGAGRGDDDGNMVRAELQRMLRDSGLTGRAQVRVTPRGVLLEIQGDLLFDSGQAELRPAAYPVLDRLAEYIPKVRHSIDVQGHSDSIPIATPAYPSNWELSAARAGRAVRYLVDAGVPPKRLRAIGLADTDPVAENDSVTGRASNRRVELLFVRPAPAQRAATPPELGSPPQEGRETTEERP